MFLEKDVDVSQERRTSSIAGTICLHKEPYPTVFYLFPLLNRLQNVSSYFLFIIAERN